MLVKQNKLFLGKFSVDTLAKKFGTPLYVYEAETIKRKHSELIKSIVYPKLNIHYACKANTNIMILKLLRGLGVKIETVSKEEIILALKVGFKSGDILFTSTSITQDEMIFVVKSKVRVNLDSLSQIELYGKLNPNTEIGLRIDHGVGAGHHSHVITGGVMSKFGIPLEHLKEARKLAEKYRLKIVRLHQHIGSNVLDSKILLKACQKLFDVAFDFGDLKSLDFGGGFGVAYSLKEKSLDIKKFGREISKRAVEFNKKYGREVNLIFEPGRYLVAESGILLAEVTEIKRNPKRTFVGLNTGFNHLVRPMMYGSYHEIINASRLTGRNIKADIVGNICESGDVFGRDRKITRPVFGDIFAIKNVGAYGYVMASIYNSRALPKEILIDGKNICLDN